MKFEIKNRFTGCVQVVLQGKNLRDAGTILGSNLPGQKARIKLMLALSITNDVKIIKEMFERDVYTKSYK